MAGRAGQGKFNPKVTDCPKRVRDRRPQKDHAIKTPPGCAKLRQVPSCPSARTVHVVEMKSDTRTFSIMNISSRALEHLIATSSPGPLNDPDIWDLVRNPELLTLYRQARSWADLKELDDDSRRSSIYHLRVMRAFLVGHIIRGSMLLRWYHGRQYLCARLVLLMYREIDISTEEFRETTTAGFGRSPC